jgi:hypothetical protein
VLVGFGDVGRPAGGAALCVNRTPEGDRMYLAAGVNRGDSGAAPGSFQTGYNKPLVFTVTRTPGPGGKTTRFYVNGQPVDAGAAGLDATPDIRHRDDFGVYVGAAMDGLGAIHGDVAEIAIYDRALTEAERQGVEAGVAGRYDITLPSTLKAIAATFNRRARKGFWAFQAVKAAAPPAVKDRSWPTSPVDHFVLRSSKSKGLKPSPQADKRTLIRRATFDLTACRRPRRDRRLRQGRLARRRSRRVVDRLLARRPLRRAVWAHWLDSRPVRRAGRVRRRALRPRLEVPGLRVRAFNADKPYDEFVRSNWPAT